MADDVDQVAGRARALAVQAGGYVGREAMSGSGGSGGPAEDGPAGAVTGQIVLRVPSAAYQRTLDELAGLGRTVSRSSQADDLTQQVVDVTSRVQSQQASVERVRALMADATSLADIVSLESELGRRQADLESLQRQQQELASQTSLSTITLDLRRTEAAVAPPAKKADGFWASVGSALSGGWHVLAAIVRGLLIAVAAFAPFLLVVAPVGAVLWYVRRRRAAGRAPSRATSGSASWPAPGDGPGPDGR